MSTTVVARPGSARARALVIAALVLLVLAVAIPTFIRLSNPVDVVSDIPIHAGLAREMVRDGWGISYSLWYLLMVVSTGGATNVTALQVASVVFLTLATLARTIVAYVVIMRKTARPFLAVAGALLILLAMPIVNPCEPRDVYLGQISANVWHNSTNILVAPFALVAFALAVSFLRDPNRRTAAVFGGAVLIVVLMKPNFALALLPVVGVVLLLLLWRARTGFATGVRVIAWAFAPVVLLLSLQYLLVIRSDSVRQTHLAVRPFSVWAEYSDDIPLSLLLSLLGPILVLIALRLRGPISRELGLAWAVFLVALAELSLLAEVKPDGAIDLQGNLFWGAYTGLLIVFLVSVVALARAFPHWPKRRMHRIALVAAIAALAIHAASGLFYVIVAGTPGFPVA